MHILNALYAENAEYQKVTAKVAGIKHPYLNVGPHRRRHQHQRGAGQGGAPARPPHDPEENPAGGRGASAPPLSQRCTSSSRAVKPSRWTVDIKPHPAGPCHETAARQPAGSTALQKHGQPCLAADSGRGHPLYTDVRLYVWRRHPRRDLRRRPAHRAGERTPSAPTSAWSWKTCAAPPGGGIARSTTSPDAGRAGPLPTPGVCLQTGITGIGVCPTIATTTMLIRCIQFSMQATTKSIKALELAMTPPMTTAVHPVDETLPTRRLAALGLQHVLVMYAGAVAVPLIVGRALKLPPRTGGHADFGRPVLSAAWSR